MIQKINIESEGLGDKALGIQSFKLGIDNKNRGVQG